MVTVVSWGENFGLIDVVDTDSFQHLGFHEVTNTSFRHHGDGDGFLNALDHVRIGHTSNATLCTNVGRNALEGHNGNRTGIFGNTSLLRVYNVHNDAALDHLGHAALDAVGTRLILVGHNDS